MSGQNPAAVARDIHVRNRSRVDKKGCEAACNHRQRDSPPDQILISRAAESTSTCATRFQSNQMLTPQPTAPRGSRVTNFRCYYHFRRYLVLFLFGVISMVLFDIVGHFLQNPCRGRYLSPASAGSSKSVRPDLN
jgi:hypothetical protein